ncbi:hypothetical protein K7X08_012733 [Anisodus acutangulus]|uniref:Small subunit ribosomal protein n=1 Tax=Anisodus acutangulus TaxID=402998 RepID=A0A9Q1MCS4_9SOLA|nr:hypothetical protein K7X08_012733 [Anisodus acutangulus]
MKLIRSVLCAANAFKLRSSDHPQAFRTFTTLPNFGIQGKTESKIYSNQHSILGMNVCSTCNVGRRFFIHSGSPKEAEMGNNSSPMDFVRGLMEDNIRGVLSGAPLSSYHIEQDVDIVHIKVLRNNALITVTDSKGNKKFGATAGKLTGKGGKVARYAAESTAEHIGREARDRGLRSVVMKVNGFTFFKKKKQAILSFREGYTHSRGEKNLVVFIEDTSENPIMDAASQRSVASNC